MPEGPADDVCEGAVAVIEPEIVIGKEIVGDIDIRPAVVVEVADGDAEAVAVFFDTGLEGDVGEDGVPFSFEKPSFR